MTTLTAAQLLTRPSLRVKTPTFAATRVAVVAVLLAGALACMARHAPTTLEQPAGPETAARPPGTVLMVLPAASEQTLADGSKRDTGYFLNEFLAPHQALLRAGYRVVIATPQGRPPTIDPESLTAKYWSSALALAQAKSIVHALPDLAAPLVLEDVDANASDLQALIVPGGQAVMVDLLDNAALKRLLLAFDRSARPVGLICHAPAILSRMPAEGRAFEGRRVTSVSGIEELYIETFIMKAQAKDRMLADALTKAGYRHEEALPGRSHALRDGHLVTSQNPYSDEDFVREMLAALMDFRHGANRGAR